MEGAYEVRCRCGEGVFTVPSLSARCPRCGRRLFWQCSCGNLVERTKTRCPNCGKVHRIRKASHRTPLPSPLWLKSVVLAGSIGAVIFTALGYWLIKFFTIMSSLKVGTSAADISERNGNILVQVVRGVWLIAKDVVSWAGVKISAHPLIPIFTLTGFVVAALIAIRQQHFLFRLKRQFRRRL